MAARKPGVLFVLLLYIVKIHLVIAQAVPGPCAGAPTGYGFCGGIYPTVLDTSNTDPLDILLPVLLLAMCKKMAAAAAEEATAASMATSTETACACCNPVCVPQSQCMACNNGCGGGSNTGCACVCGSSGNNGCGSANKANACGGCCPDPGFSGGCGGCPNAMSGNCGGCMCC